MDSRNIAKNCIKVAEKMIEINELETAVNRLYIASENIAAVIVSKYNANAPKRHDKISNAIESLWKQGKLSKDYSVTMRDLYKKHLFVDYGKVDEKITLNTKDAMKLLDAVRSFYEEIEK
jgi:uncharacterized protein (UPF0332 family)